MDKDLFLEKIIEFRNENLCAIHHPVTNLACYYCGVRSGITYVYEEAITENWGA